MRHLRLGDYRAMPWKNGGGSTTEIAIFPASSGISGHPFDWRVSIADVVTDGPFSSFPGYDRHIMVIEGNGITLALEGHGEIDLSKPFCLAAFSGDWKASARLVGGPVRDFNLMVARAKAKSTLTVEQIAGPMTRGPEGGTRIIYVLDGEIVASGEIIAAGETIIVGADEAVEIKALGPPAKLAICRIAPLGR